jgi:hypothetical protein
MRDDADPDRSDQQEAPDLPGGEISDTETPEVEVGEVEVEPLPDGTVEARTPDERFTFATQDHRLLVQELVRAGLALSFVVLLAAVIVFGYLKVESDAWSNVKEYLDILVPALSALLGSATGFYFASRR